jgi:hypothetical protein
MVWNDVVKDTVIGNGLKIDKKRNSYLFLLLFIDNNKLIPVKNNIYICVIAVILSIYMPALTRTRANKEAIIIINVNSGRILFTSMLNMIYLRLC